MREPPAAHSLHDSNTNYQSGARSNGSQASTQLNQGALLSTQQKAMVSLSSAPTTADPASQTDLSENTLPPRCQLL